MGKTEYGMQTFDQSLYDLFEKKVITQEEALKMLQRKDLELLFQGLR